MNCPICQGETKVVNSRPGDQGRSIRRRRECLKCRQRFSTYEKISLIDFQVRKSDGKKEPYYRHKLEGGLRKALDRRPVAEKEFQKLLFTIENDIFNLEKETVSTEQIGRIVLTHLREMDKVAYLRFASIHRNFRSPREFEREIQKLEKA
ncbi:MAG: transcriptional regulator NrdR [Patescibacteria group bacterium]|nr:transcriptional regulator NrdR [Patescibacteria group bacterium]